VRWRRRGNPCHDDEQHADRAASGGCSSPTFLRFKFCKFGDQFSVFAKCARIFGIDPFNPYHVLAGRELESH
jgi:hypothetical protein